MTVPDRRVGKIKPTILWPVRPCAKAPVGSAARPIAPRRSTSRRCVIVRLISGPAPSDGMSLVALRAPDAMLFHRPADLAEDRRIVDRRRHGPGLAVGDLLHGAAQDFPRPRL